MEGVIFSPDNQECIAFLIMKIANLPLPCNDIIDYLDPYDEDKLPILFEAAQEKDLYFFSRLRRKGKSGSKNADRTVGDKGTWHGDQNRDVIYGDLGSVGSLHTFSYREPGSVYDQCFIMTEYHLREDTELQYDPLKQPVLCVLRLKDERKGRKELHKKKQKLSDVSIEETAMTRLHDAESYYEFGGPSYTYSDMCSTVTSPNGEGLVEY